MRTFSLATPTLLLSLFMVAQIGFAQEPARGFAGYCPYGCGPYLPLITTPSISFQTISPNPVGARNATAGLVAGATDSTLSEQSGNTSSVYTTPVWYSGGGMPLVAPAVNSPVGTMRPGRFEAIHREPEMHERKAEPQNWTYIAADAPSETGVHSLEAASAATGVKPAKHNYTNDDVQQQNEKNGYVHYDSKTEKIQ